MALPITVSITCGGTELAKGDDYLRLTLAQDLFGAHVLTITAPFDRVENAHTPFFAKAPDRLLGQAVALQVQVVAGFSTLYTQPLQFKGYVTGLSTGQDTDQMGSVDVTVHSADFQLTDGLQRRTFRKLSLRDIFAQVLNLYDLPHQLQPRYTAKLPYAVQYQETNFAFLSRLAATYGEWLYSDGLTLRLGPPPAGAEIPFAADGIHNRFSFGLVLRPTRATLYGYDYHQHRHTTANTADQAVAGLQRNPYGKLVLQQSDKLFPHAAHALTEAQDPTQAQLTAEAQRLKGHLAASLVTVQGQSENPALVLGGVISIRGKGLGSEHTAADSFGVYCLTALTHYIDGRGNYRNTFTAIPHLLDVPPVNPHYDAPAGIPELADVIDDQDPAALGRVRVRFHWPVAKPADAETDWVRVLTPYSGAGKGQLFTPEIGSQVLVSYQHNQADQPLVQGNLFHARNTDKAKYSHGSAPVKGIQTKGGNKITFHDQAGEERILVSNGKKKQTAVELSFKGDGSVHIQSKGPVTVNGSVITLDAGEKGEIKMHAKNITLVAEDDVKVSAKTKGISLKAQKNIVADATEKLQLTGTQGAGLTSPQTVDLGTGATVNISATVVNQS